MDTKQKQIAQLLRRHLQLPPEIEISDGEILDGTAGTFLRARAELTIEIAEMKAAIKNALPQWMRRMIAD